MMRSTPERDFLPYNTNDEIFNTFTGLHVGAHVYYKIYLYIPG